MPIQYRCDPVRKATYVVWDGPTSGADWRATAARQLADPVWPTGDRYITDLRTSAIDVNEVYALVKELTDSFRPKIPPTLRQAIIAPGNFDLIDHYEKTFRIQSMVFVNLEPACAWLGLDLVDTENILQDLRRSLRN